MKNALKYITLSLCITFLTNVRAEGADTVKIAEHLTYITKSDTARNYVNVERLDNVAEYIFNEFSKYADTTYYQSFRLGTKGVHDYKNVVCVFGEENQSTLVVGAHYDVFGDSEGADDNASGVVGLLELARLLKGKKLNHRIEIVAYTLEEPPFFRTKLMGSYVHANSLVQNNVDVYGMICLEMIGFFSDHKKSQDYPIGALSCIYGNKGDYITLVNKFSKGKFSRKFNSLFKKQNLVRTKKFTGPKRLSGIDFSDHLNYWKLGFHAVMITDTAFYRNKNYHQETDTMESLDLNRMRLIIDSVLYTLINLK